MTKPDPRAQLRALILHDATIHEVAEQVRLRADRLRQTAPVTETQLVQVLDSCLARFYGDAPSSATAD